MTPKGEEFVRAFMSFPLDEMPAAEFWRHAMRDSAARGSDLVAGGTDRLTEALAALHPESITKDVVITTVRQREDGVALVDATGATFDGRAAIFCLPLRPLRALQFEGGAPPPLSERLRVLEVDLQCKARTQLTPRPSTPSLEYVFQDRSPRVFWRLPETGPGGEYVMQALDWGRGVKAATRSSPPMFDGAIFVSHQFGDDPLIGGAFAYPRAPGVTGGVIRTGRLVFAGGDLSEAPGWMEGAVRAAEQAVAALKE
jgi:monoamine oxidase